MIADIFDATHPEYDLESPKWEYARDHYEARVLDDDTTLTNYLVKRSQGETDAAFQERKDLADYTPFFAYIVESMAGRLFAVDDKTTRTWQDEEMSQGLGDPKEPGTPAYQMTHNADGKGTNWNTLFKQSAMDFSVYRRLWFIVDPKTSSRNQPAVKIINPLDVYDWVEEGERLVQVKVDDTSFTRDGIFELAEEEEQRLVYELDGWKRFVKRMEENPDKGKMGEPDEIAKVYEVERGAYYFEDKDGKQCLPIFYVELPLRRNSGYILARKNNAIFNKESAKDWLEWAANFPKLISYSDNDLFGKQKEALSEGGNFLQGSVEAKHPTQYIAPDTGPAEINRESLQQKIEHFLYVAFKEYSDSSREKTATERRIDDAEGVGSYLELLRSAVDEAENRAGWLVEQCFFPKQVRKITEEGELVTEQVISGNADLWGQFFVERSSDFLPVDDSALMKEIKENVFGFDPIPTDETARLDAAKQLFDHLGIKYDEEALTEVINQAAARESQGRDTDAELERVLNEPVA
ncbi:hypothetical protein [Gracilimonas sediminicola]|uniref:Uncharacterized protein n=1 Tax=Gracilimonas sediminicola TaxID=2952158 RepID=A0A9X2RE57_9BACT|nr:hypothetical protein [Gracilimonas sediminicola]MCP9290008.1 hypothetical protein [Gracilimonas sediminicola]